LLIPARERVGDLLDCPSSMAFPDSLTSRTSTPPSQSQEIQTAIPASWIFWSSSSSVPMSSFSQVVRICIQVPQQPLERLRIRLVILPPREVADMRRAPEVNSRVARRAHAGVKADREAELRSPGRSGAADLASGSARRPRRRSAGGSCAAPQAEAAGRMTQPGARSLPASGRASSWRTTTSLRPLGSRRRGAVRSRRAGPPARAGSGGRRVLQRSNGIEHVQVGDTVFTPKRCCA
jgi:hypothetical protein